MSKKVVAANLNAYYWLDYRKFSSSDLAKEHIDALSAVDALDDCELTVSVELVAPEGTDFKELAAAVREFERKGMATVRAQAGKALATIAQTCAALEGSDRDAELKKAQSALKSLDDFLDKFIFGQLGAELRRYVAKAIDIKPDDLTTLNASKFKLRLNPDVFGYGTESKDDDDDKDILKSSLKAVKKKDEWLPCIVVWSSEDGRVLVAPAGKKVNNAHVVALKEKLNLKKKSVPGQVRVSTGLWEFEFAKAAPGGGNAEKFLKGIVEEQFEVTVPSIDVKSKVGTLSDGDDDEDEDEDDDDDTSTAKKSSSTTKGKNEPARPKSKRT